VREEEEEKIKEEEEGKEEDDNNNKTPPEPEPIPKPPEPPIKLEPAITPRLDSPTHSYGECVITEEIPSVEPTPVSSTRSTKTLEEPRPPLPVSEPPSHGTTFERNIKLEHIPSHHPKESRCLSVS
jgi:hypothetical protein